MLTEPPATEPGSAYAYSNLGYTIAGAMLEQAADASWEDLVRERVFAPLGMTSAGFGPPEAGGDRDHPDQPWGHVSRGGERAAMAPGPWSDNPLVIGPAGTVNCSIEDLARYAALHLQGARGVEGLLLAPASFERLHTDSYEQDYAMGWARLERSWAGGTALNHSGSNGMWFAVIWIAPKRDLALVAATNDGGSTAFAACDAAIGAMLKAYLRPSEPEQKAGQAPPHQ